MIVKITELMAWILLLDNWYKQLVLLTIMLYLVLQVGEGGGSLF